MTPKERAIELLEKFTKSQYYGCLGCGEDYDDKHDSAKECALIAVDEILDVITGIYDYDFEVLNPYWEEVKKEIENL